jgi:hypothetical protein
VLHLAGESAALAIEPRPRHAGGGLVLLLHLGDEPYRFPLGADGLGAVLGSEPLQDAGDPLHVPAHGWRILEVS